MANKSFRKSQLIAFDNAAAGHDGVLSNPAGTLIVKPCTQVEIEFYESSPKHPELLPYLPTYYGRLALGSDVSQAAGALILPGETTPDEPTNETTAHVPVVNHAWKPSGGAKIQTELAIVLENVAAGYEKPNILDVKLGARLWADDSPPEKRAKLDKVAAETTSKSLGFRIAGMKAYHGMQASGPASVSSDGYKVFDKHYGRSWSVDTVSQGFEEFFRINRDVRPSSPIRKVIRRFIEDLEGLVKVLEMGESRMYSASLLFVYEGNSSALQTSFTREAEMVAAHQSRTGASDTESQAPSAAAEDIHESDDEELDLDKKRPKFPPIQNLKLIDFAHAHWSPGQGSDENLLYGVRNVIKIMGALLG